MQGRPGMSLALVLPCLAVIAAAVDNDVQQVNLPNVVKFPLGPRMEVSEGGPREYRAADFHNFPSGCLSCTGGGTFGSSSSSSSSFGYPAGDYRPFSEPDGNSYKHEVRTESKSVNGAPVYDLFHERRFEDGHLIHDDRREKGSKDVDASFGGYYPSGGASSGYSRNVQESHVQSSSVGSSSSSLGHDSAAASGGSFARGETSGSLDSISERLRQQMLLLQKGQNIPSGRGNHRAVYSQTRYVNGQPVYVKKEERKYEDGRLIYNNTEEKGPGDLGTQNGAQQYDASGALVGPAATGGGVYERREEQRQFSSSSQGSGTYPLPPSGDTSGGLGSSYSYWQEWHDSYPGSYTPTGGYSSHHSQDASNEFYRPSYRPSYTPSSGSSSTQYSQESSSSSSSYRPSYRPSSSSSTSHYSQESREGSAYRPSYRPAGSTSSQNTQYSREESSAYRPSYTPSSSVTSTQQTHETREQSGTYRPYRPAGSTSTQYTQTSEDSREDNANYRPYRPSSSVTSTQQTHETREQSASYRPHRPAGSTSTQYTQTNEDSRETSNYRPSYRPSGSSHYWREDLSSSHRPHRPEVTSTHREESREETSSSLRPAQRPASGSSTEYSQERREDSYSSGYRPSYRPSSGGYSTQYSREDSSSAYRPSYTPQTSSTQYTQETREESSSSRTHQPDRWTQTQYPTADRYRPAHRPSSSSTHYTQESREETSSSYRPSTDRTTQYTQETTEDSSTARRPVYRPSGSSQTREESYESRWREEQQGYNFTPSPDGYHTTLVQQNARLPEDTTHGPSDAASRGGATVSQNHGTYGSGGARTTTLDLSSSSSVSGSSFTDHLLGASSGRRHDTGEDSSEFSQSYEYSQRQDRHSSRRNQDSSVERTQQTREDTDRVGIPGVLSGPHTDNGNDIRYNKDRYDISPLDDVAPVLPSVDNEIDSGDFPTIDIGVGEVDSGDIERDDDRTTGSRHDASRTATTTHSRHDTSRTDTSTQVNPGHGYGESSYHYYQNRSSTHGSADGVPSYGRGYGSEADTESSHTYPGVEGSTRYHYNESWRHSTAVDGHAQPEYGSSSSSSSSATQVSNCGQVNCVVAGDGQVASSRRTQTRVSTRYVNGELVGITHNVRYFEDGRLVHENQTEKSIDELTDEDMRKYGIEHLRLVQGSYEPGSYSQRHEVRQEKKYVNGEQVYDLHHEKRFEDGDLVYDKRSEKDEDDFEGPGPHPEQDLGGAYSQQTYEGADQRHEVTQSHHLQQHVSSGGAVGATDRRASETRQVTDTAHVSAVPVYTSHRYEARRQEEFVNGQPTYQLHHERRFKNGSLIYENKTELNEDDLQTSSSAGHHDALQQILAGSTLNTASEASYSGSSSSSQGSSYGAGASQSSYGGSSLPHTSYGSSSSSSQGSTYGGGVSQSSYGGSSSSSSYSASSSSESRDASRSPGFPLGVGSGSSRATTTVLGGGSFGSASQQEASSSSSSSSSGGCLSCMLVASGYSPHGSSVGTEGAAVGGAGGYSHRQEMSVEERYEDGQLVHGREEERVFEDGELVHENRRQYSDPSQSSQSSALQSAGAAGSCGANFCQNGGTCIPGFKGPLCVCAFGFKGLDCSEAFCPKRFCRYGGTCAVSGPVHVCTCQPGFTGYRCQNRSRRHSRRHASRP